MKIGVIDGQGGGIGKEIIELLRRELPQDTYILALGTNALATSVMLKAGADEGASGENAIAINCYKMDVITGPLGIIAANSMLGELTPGMARAVAESPARKILIPLSKCNIEIAGTEPVPLPILISKAVELIKKLY